MTLVPMMSHLVNATLMNMKDLQYNASSKIHWLTSKQPSAA